MLMNTVLITSMHSSSLSFQLSFCGIQEGHWGQRGTRKWVDADAAIKLEKLKIKGS